MAKRYDLRDVTLTIDGVKIRGELLEPIPRFEAHGTISIGTDQAELEALPAPTATVELLPLEEAAASVVEARPVRMDPEALTATAAELEAAGEPPSVEEILDGLEAQLVAGTNVPEHILFGPPFGSPLDPFRRN
jgi:hypothetical protein